LRKEDAGLRAMPPQGRASIRQGRRDRRTRLHEKTKFLNYDFYFHQKFQLISAIALSLKEN
jgi:hypothetical protein